MLRAILTHLNLLRNSSPEVGCYKWLMWQNIQSVRAKFDEIRSDDWSANIWYFAITLVKFLECFRLTW